MPPPANDAANGPSPALAWQSHGKVNATKTGCQSPFHEALEDALAGRAALV
ncbi:MAG: hypothetical protein NTW21_24175 [Verrucomicrobia bacterium]|nr:hypothetical protein [Verrucomicrobiota bacterium]